MEKLVTKYKLSIITINFNNLVGLKRTVESVINQTWKEFEYIIIDGGSTDGSAQYIQEMQEHFNYWVSEQDKGIYNAMNKGIVVANGEYLLFLNSGDCFDTPNTLYRTLCYIDGVNHLVIGGVVDQNGLINNKFYNQQNEGIKTFLKHSTFPHQSTFIRTNLISENKGYNEKMRIRSDYYFFCSVCRKKINYTIISDVIAKIESGGISQSIESRAWFLQETLFIRFICFRFIDLKLIRKLLKIKIKNHVDYLSYMYNKTFV